MKRRLLGSLVCALMIGAVVAAVQQPPAASQRKVRVAAVVLDRGGKPIEDLRPSEFEVWIGVYRVPIEAVTFVSPTSDQGRIIILVLDDLTVSPATGLRVKEAARRFVTRMRPGDQMAIIGLDGSVGQTTDDRAVLLKRIEDYSALATPRIPFERIGEHVLRTLTAISRSLAEIPGRKIVVGIGSSWVFDTPVPPPSVGRDLQQEWIAAVRSMASADANLYVVDPGGLFLAPFPTSGSTGFARETGGHSFAHNNDTSQVAERIMAEASTYYVLEVSDPPTGRNAELREVDVRVLRQGTTVRARRWIPGGKSVR